MGNLIFIDLNYFANCPIFLLSDLNLDLYFAEKVLELSLVAIWGKLFSILFNYFQILLVFPESEILYPI